MGAPMRGTGREPLVACRVACAMQRDRSGACAGFARV